jgi:hypothetical protein
MGAKRRKAIERLNGLRPQVELHLAKIHEQPDAREQNHWRAEVRGWLRSMDRELGQIGKRTRSQWEVWLTARWAELGEHDDNE